MKKFVVGVLAVIGALSLLALMFAACIGVASLLSSEPLPSRAMLEIDFEKGVIESIPDDLVATIMLEETPVLRDLVEAIDRAAEDDRVRVLIGRIGSGGLGLAHVQELRDAVLRFRQSGKPAWAFSETFGEFGPGNGGYYLASAFDEVWLQPSGDVGMTGLMYETPFVRGLLDKLDVTPRLDQRWEYKNAMNIYTDREYNEPFREAMQELLDSQFSQMVTGIAEARGLSAERVVELFDRGPYLAAEALEHGLVDHLGYRDQVYDAARDIAGEDAEVLEGGDYIDRDGSGGRGPTVALIYGSGAVTRGESSYSPFDGTTTMGSESVARAFREAIEDERVEAILFRVDSPGGSYVASDTIWRETVRAREAGKPVVVSMGNLAGSGGYFVAMNADRIVAQPGTITASIGVLGGKLVTSGFWDKIGVSWDGVHSSENGEIWSPRHDYDPEEFERFQAGLDRIYEDFTGKVAAGRDLPLERVHDVARGRIWSGADALELGLVDELGGMDVALAAIREELELEEDAPLRIKELPRRRTSFEQMMDFYGVRGSADKAVLVKTLQSVQPALRLLRQLGLVENAGVLSMPEAVRPVR